MVKYEDVVGNELADCLIPRPRKPLQEEQTDKPVLPWEGYLIQKLAVWITYQTDFNCLAESHVGCNNDRVKMKITGNPITCKMEKRSTAGNMGKNGTYGNMGKNGTDGNMGKNGTNGNMGKNGTNENMGKNGTDGNMGKNGTDWKNGTDGNMRKNGTDGNMGKNGTDGNMRKKGTDGNIGKNGTDGNMGKNGTDGNMREKGTDGNIGKTCTGLLSTSMILSLMLRNFCSLVSHFNKARFVFICLFASLICQSHAAQVIRTKQELPLRCYDSLRNNSCPKKFDKDWGNLTSKCCAGFAGTVLHCQVMKNGSNFPACLPDKSVEAGKAGQLTVDSAGMPEFITDPCEPGTYQSHASVSSELKYPYCLQTKTRCRDNDRVPLCRGGSAADDMCTCDQGFRPVGQGCRPFGAFTQDDDCFCQRLTCPDGEVEVRSPAAPTHNPPCNEVDIQFPTQFSCVNITPAPTSIPPFSHGSTLCFSTWLYVLLVLVVLFI